MPVATPNKTKGAWVALCTKSSYLQGLVVLQHALQSTSPPTQYPLVAMITPPFPQEARDVLRKAGIVMKEVESLKPTGKSGNEVDTRFDDTWTKVRAFEWTEYERIITLDCDMLVRKNMDDLFDLPLQPDQIAGTHACTCNPRKLAHYPKDWTVANCAYTAQTPPSHLSQPPITILDSSPLGHQLINGGLIILTPNKELFEDLVTFLKESPLIKNFSFADQDLYATFFRGRWVPIPYVYNALKTLKTAHTDIWNDDDVRNVHYILDKPWQSTLSNPYPQSADPETLGLHSWWSAAYEELLAKMKDEEGSGWEIVDEWVVR